MAVIPRGPRASIETTGDSMIITVPSRKYWSQIIFNCIYLIVFLTTFVKGLLLLDSPRAIVDILSIPSFWIIILINPFILCTMLWQLFGKEEIRVTTQAICCAKKVFGIRYPQEYFSLHIKNLRITQNPSNTKNPSYSYSIGFKGGWIAFDYGADTIECINNVAEVEARQILAEIVKQFPQYETHVRGSNAILEKTSSGLSNGISSATWINQNANFLEFECDNVLRFEKLRIVFNALRDAKKQYYFPPNSTWYEYFDKDALAHFWWPSEKELSKYKNHWDETPVHLRLTESSLRKPWMLDNMIESIRDGQYELVNCYLLNDTRGRLEFIPNAGSCGGSDALKALVESFGFRVVAGEYI